MTLMLIAVTIVSLLIGQVTTAIIVAILVLFNVITGTQQEVKARRSVDALAKLQTPKARVIRDGVLLQIDATGLVPGDIVELESGDLVPADGRDPPIGEPRDPGVVAHRRVRCRSRRDRPRTPPGTALADRTSMVFQNTSITRGTARIVVVETGMRTQMGRIARCSRRSATRSPPSSSSSTASRRCSASSRGAPCSSSC